MSDEPPKPPPRSVSDELRQMMRDAEGLPLSSRLQGLAEQLAREGWGEGADEAEDLAEPDGLQDR